MEAKVCTKCGEEKPVSEYRTQTYVYRGARKYRKASWCKSCESICKKQCYENKKEQYLKNNKEYRTKNAEKYKAYDKQRYTGERKVQALQRLRKWNIENKDRKQEFQKKWREDNPDKVKAYQTKAMYKNLEKRKSVPQIKIRHSLSSRFSQALKAQSASKTSKSAVLLGLSFDIFTKIMLDQGYNPNTDHIDHIVPCKWFDLTIPEHQLVSQHYLNLQPLQAKENLSKGATLPNDWIDKISEICNIRDIESEPIIAHINSQLEDS